jgi:hypothetical protein
VSLWGVSSVYPGDGAQLCWLRSGSLGISCQVSASREPRYSCWVQLVWGLRVSTRAPPLLVLHPPTCRAPVLSSPAAM